MLLKYNIEPPVAFKNNLNVLTLSGCETEQHNPVSKSPSEDPKLNTLGHSPKAASPEIIQHTQGKQSDSEELENNFEFCSFPNSAAVNKENVHEPTNDQQNSYLNCTREPHKPFKFVPESQVMEDNPMQCQITPFPQFSRIEDSQPNEEEVNDNLPSEELLDKALENPDILDYENMEETGFAGRSRIVLDYQYTQVSPTASSRVNNEIFQKPALSPIPESAPLVPEIPRNSERSENIRIQQTIQKMAIGPNLVLFGMRYFIDYKLRRAKRISSKLSRIR